MKKLLITFLMMMSLVCLSAREKGYEFRGEIYGFAGLTDYLQTSGGISITNGYRITERLFVGAGTGFEMSKAVYKYVDVGDSYSYAPQRMIPVFAGVDKISIMELSSDPNCARAVEVYRKYREELKNKTIIIAPTYEELINMGDLFETNKTIIWYYAEDEADVARALKAVEKYR